MDDAATPPVGMDLRVSKLEWVVPRISAELTTTVDRLNEVAKEQTTMKQVQLDIRDDVTSLKKTLDRLTWAIVTMAFSIAASAISLALVIASHS